MIGAQFAHPQTSAISFISFESELQFALILNGFAVAHCLRVSELENVEGGSQRIRLKQFD